MISFVTLGDAVIDVHGSRITPVAAKKFALLLVLAAARGAIVPRATLCELLFGRLDEKKAQHSLRELAYQLRQLGVDLDGDAHGLVIDKGLFQIDWIDVASLPRIDAARLRDIQRGFLPRYAPTLSEAFTEWLDQFRTRISLEVAQACLREIQTAKVSGDWKTAELAARACLALDPLNGHATIALAEVLAITGSATQAASVLDAFANELGPEARKFAVSVQKLRRKIAEGINRSYSRSTFPFVGREEEMRLLSRVFEEAKQSGPRAVLLFGEPGIGKSRIAAEFAARADLEGAAVVRVGAHPYDKQRPMGAFVDIVRSLLGLPGALGSSPESMVWLQRLIGVAPAPESGGLSNEDTAHAITCAIVDLFGAVSAEHPLLLLLDDAQWIDRNSLEVLRQIVLDSDPAGLLVVLTSRDEAVVFEAGDWSERLVAREVGSLSRSVALELLADELPSESRHDRSLAEWMTDVANGNPFYADSLLAHYRVTGEQFVVPPQLSAIVDRRIRALSPEARDVLETIVALGKHATIERIERILVDYGTALVRLTRELGTARLISGDQHVAPAHWLIAESVQRNLVPFTQLLLYRRIATILESELRIEGDSSELWECAQAWVAAGDSDHAADMIAGCAEHALSIGRAREASDLYYRAAGIVLGQRTENLAEASIRAAASAGDPTAVLRAIPLLSSRRGRRLHDDIELAELRARLWCDCELDQTLDALQQCFTARWADRQHRLSAAIAFMQYCTHGRLILKGIEASDSLATLVEDTSGDHDAPWLQSAAVFHSAFGNPDRVPALVQNITAVAAVARPDHAAALLRQSFTCLHRIGFVDETVAICERALATAQSAGLARMVFDFRLSLASLELDIGDVERGRAWFAQLDLPAVPQAGAADQSKYWSYQSVAAEFALYDDDRASLASICESVRRLPTASMGPQTLRAQAVLCCLAKHLQGEEQDHRALADLLTAEHVPGYESGILGDLEITVLITILRETGLTSLATAHLRRYLVERRRRRTPLSANLIRAAKRIDASDLLTTYRVLQPLSISCS